MSVETKLMYSEGGLYVVPQVRDKIYISDEEELKTECNTMLDRVNERFEIEIKTRNGLRNMKNEDKVKEIRTKIITDKIKKYFTLSPNYRIAVSYEFLNADKELVTQATFVSVCGVKDVFITQPLNELDEEYNVCSNQISLYGDINYPRYTAGGLTTNKDTEIRYIRINEIKVYSEGTDSSTIHKYNVSNSVNYKVGESSVKLSELQTTAINVYKMNAESLGLRSDYTFKIPEDVNIRDVILRIKIITDGVGLNSIFCKTRNMEGIDNLIKANNNKPIDPPVPPPIEPPIGPGGDLGPTMSNSNIKRHNKKFVGKK